MGSHLARNVDYSDWSKEELIDYIQNLEKRKKYGLVWEDKPEEGQKAVKYFPTIRVYRKNILVKEFVGYTKAEDILKVVKYRTVLLR